jgi:hypothetical protein
MGNLILPGGRISQTWPVLFILELSGLDNQTQLTQGECKMPATISAWCLILFFLWYGLAAFVPALSTDMFRKIGAVLALGFVLFSLIGM